MAILRVREGRGLGKTGTTIRNIKSWGGWNWDRWYRLKFLWYLGWGWNGRSSYPTVIEPNKIVLSLILDSSINAQNGVLSLWVLIHDSIHTGLNFPFWESWKWRINRWLFELIGVSSNMKIRRLDGRGSELRGVGRLSKTWRRSQVSAFVYWLKVRSIYKFTVPLTGLTIIKYSWRLQRHHFTRIICSRHKTFLSNWCLFLNLFSDAFLRLPSTCKPSSTGISSDFSSSFLYKLASIFLFRMVEFIYRFHIVVNFYLFFHEVDLKFIKSLIKRQSIVDTLIDQILSKMNRIVVELVSIFLDYV